MTGQMAGMVMGGIRISERTCAWCGQSFKPRRRDGHGGRAVRFCSAACYHESRGVKARTEKPCSRCYEVQPIERFPRDRTTSDGHKAHCKTCAVPDQRAYSLRRNYGITLAEYEAMYEAQGGLCAICSRPAFAFNGKHASIDHDHETGAIRELLCGPCNSGLGYFQDDPDVLEAAAAYLRQHAEIG